MKTKPCLLLALAASVTAVVNAQWPASDSFAYDTATLANGNGGTGFSFAWRGTESIQEPYAESTYTIVPGLSHAAAIEPAGNAIANVVQQSLANTDCMAYRELPQFIDMGADGVYYMSFLYTTNDLAGWARISLEGSAGSHFLRFMKYANEARWQIAIREPAYASPPAGNILVQSDTGTFTVDTTYLVLVKIVTKAGAAVSDEVYMRAFAPGETLPAAGQDPEWTLSVTEGILTDSEYYDVVLASRSRLVAGHTHILDEVRVGTTLADVMVVPADPNPFAGYPVSPEGLADTGDWMGIVYVGDYPWVYSFELANWLYSGGEGWFFVVK